MFNEPTSKLSTLDNWFNSPQGIAVEQAFSLELIHLSDYLRGTTLLQLGNCGSNAWLESMHYTYKWIAASYPHYSSAIESSFHQLPFMRESIDCIIMPLTLSAFPSHHELIDEIDRILKPMGYLIILGVNPLSLWGILMQFKRFSCFGSSIGKFPSVFSLKRALFPLGYIQSNLSYFYYSLPVKQKKWVEKFKILNELGKLFSLYPAGFYCLVVQKNQEDLSLLRPVNITDELLCTPMSWQSSYQLKNTDKDN